MSKYLKTLVDNKYISQTHSNGIQNMHDNLILYNFTDIFSDSDKIHTQTRKLIMDNSSKNVKYLINNNNTIDPICLSKSTIISGVNGIITKFHIIKPDYPADIKDAITMLLLRDAYYQDLIYNTALSNNCSTIIIPEVTKTGKITLTNNEIIIFFQSKLYIDPNPPSFSHGYTDKYKYVSDYQNLVKIFQDGFAEFDHLMNELQLHHNDIFNNVAQFTEEYFNKLYVIVTENDPMKIEGEYNNFLRETTMSGRYYDLVDGFEYVEDEFEFNYDLIKDKEFKSVSNLLKYNNKLVIIDYEHTGISRFQPNLRDYCRKNCINNSSL